LILWPRPNPQRASERLRANLLRCAPEGYFGQDGVFANGLFTTWFSANIYLISATVDESTPRSLHLRS
jgi:hypothetical protein